MSDQNEDCDIVDSETLINHPEATHLNSQNGTQALVVPVLIPELQNNKGRRTHSPIEQHLRDVLCVSATRCVYGLQALGFSAQKSRDMVGKELSTYGIDKAMRRGRKICHLIFNVKNADDLKERELNKYHCNPSLQNNGISKDKSVQNELFHLRHLDQAYSRAQEIFGGIYKAQRASCEKTRTMKINDALKYRESCNSKPLPELLLISYRSRINCSWLWQSYWYYRYIFDAATSLGNLFAGFALELSTIQFYVLYRMCEEEITGEMTEHQACKHFLQNQIENLIGKDAFMSFARDNLEPLELLSRRPSTISELEDRCSLPPGMFILGKTQSQVVSPSLPSKSESQKIFNESNGR